MLKNKKMFDKLKGTISQFLPTIIAGLILFGIGIVLADKDNWNKPECDPPNCNVPQPINIGGEWQAKDAPIGFNLIGSGGKGFINSTRWVGNINGDFVIGAGTEVKGENMQLSIGMDGLITLHGDDKRITKVDDPINDDDVATKGWVLAQLGGGGGGGFVTVAQSDDAKFTKEDHDKVKNFMYEKGGVIIGVVCKRSDNVSTFYSGHAFLSIPLGGYFIYTLGSGNYSFSCTAGCSYAGEFCTRGWRIIGIK